MAGMRVVVVACDELGNVDLDDLRAKLAEHGEHVAALMITYPSTHGVYEQAVGEICGLVHDAGGQVYVDGANLNALVGLAQPGQFGADVSHLNLHKTFCIPHGGGGPGVGPVAVRGHLRRFLPNHPLQPAAGPASGPGPVSAAPWGSASILPISWAYIRLMGPDGLRQATQVAILNANYIARRLDEHFPVLYSGQNGLVAHECILDLRPDHEGDGRHGRGRRQAPDRLRPARADDELPRGRHAHGRADRVGGPGRDRALLEAMIHIRSEIDRVAAGEWPADDNPLVNAPHTAEMLTRDWTHPYTREEACYPAPSLRRMKYWSPVRRIEGAYGDRNLVVTCPPVTEYATSALRAATLGQDQDRPPDDRRAARLVAHGDDDLRLGAALHPARAHDDATRRARADAREAVALALALDEQVRRDPAGPDGDRRAFHEHVDAPAWRAGACARSGCARAAPWAAASRSRSRCRARSRPARRVAVYVNESAPV